MKVYWFNYRDPDRPDQTVYFEMTMSDGTTIEDARERLDKGGFELETIFAQGESSGEEGQP